MLAWPAGRNRCPSSLSPTPCTGWPPQSRLTLVPILLRRAVHRGAAWPAERPSSWLVVLEAVSRWQVAHRRAVMVAKRGRRCPQEHGGVAQRAPAGHGGPGRAEAGRAFVSVSVSSVSVRSPVSGAGVQHHACLSTRPLSGVRCGRLSVQMSGVQRGCPVSVGSRVHCVRPGGCRGVAAGQAAAWLGWPASAWSPALSTASSSAARVGTWRSRLAQVCWASGGVGLDLAVVVGGGWAVARSTAWATRIGWMDAGIARWWRAGVRSEAATTLRGHRVRLRPSHLVAASLRGWTATCACGRGAAAAYSERRLLDAGDVLTCKVWGWR